MSTIGLTVLYALLATGACVGWQLVRAKEPDKALSYVGLNPLTHKATLRIGLMAFGGVILAITVAFLAQAIQSMVLSILAVWVVGGSIGVGFGATLRHLSRFRWKP